LELIKIMAELNALLSGGPRVTGSEAYLKLQALYRLKQEEIKLLRAQKMAVYKDSAK
jgi:hypothetical protein